MEAVEFLLKPYEQGRVDIALERVRARIHGSEPPVRLEDLIRKLDGRTHDASQRIALHDREHIVLANSGEIFYFLAEGDDVYARMRDRRLSVRRALREVERMMELQRFFRANRLSPGRAVARGLLRIVGSADDYTQFFQCFELATRVSYPVQSLDPGRRGSIIPRASK